ncbi:MAG: N,N-dimethylformamidase beta subunit family domain-containing protein, partial [Myxococcaceae bacterium]
AGCRDRGTKPAEEPDREGGHVFGVPVPPLADPGAYVGPRTYRPGGAELRRVKGPPPSKLLGRTPSPNPIPDENAKPGEPGWSTFRQAFNGEIELYASTEAAEAGESIGVKVSTDSPQEVTAEVLRIGWYGGVGARKVWSGGPFGARPQAPCPLDAATGLVECSWTVTFTVKVGADWVSGLFLIKVRRTDGFARWTPLIIRDHRAAELLFQPALNTSQAYNAWHGQSLYVDASGKLPWHQSVMVSYDRPFLDQNGAGLVLYEEVPFARMLEKHGYDVTYASNLDFGRFTDVLGGISAFAIAGHDEYWLPEERSQVDAALAAGSLSLAHFGGNGSYWRIRTLPSADGRPRRIIVCYKGTWGDPEPGSTVRFRDAPNPWPENALFGTMYEDWQLVPFPLTVSNPSHWLFAGTNLRGGDLLHGLVGNEYDLIQSENGATPPGLVIAAEGPVVTANGVPSKSQVVERTLPSGTLVFSAGSIYWAHGLRSDPNVEDGRLERMTLNVLERALSHRRAPRQFPDATGPVPPGYPPDGRWAGEVSAFAGVAGQSGERDGTGSTALFNGPTGLATTADGRVLVAEAIGNRVRLIGVDGAHTVTLLAGTGERGHRDGPGAQAMFAWPTSVAVGSDGAAYVTDAANHVIRRIELSPPYQVTTHAGLAQTPGFADGAGPTARFSYPTAIAADAAGSLFVADQANHRIRKLSVASRGTTTIAGSGGMGRHDSATGAQATFNNPSALAVGRNGDVFVFDGGNGLLRRVAAAGTRAVTTLAGEQAYLFGYRDGPGNTARFRAQVGMAVGPSGELLLADTGNYRIRSIVPGADAASTRVYTIAGSGRLGTALGPAASADIAAPTGLAVCPDGSLVVSDSYHHLIRRIGR